MAISKMENMTWKEINQIDKDKSVVIVALSPIEEHGPHLPLGTDYISAKDLLEEVVNNLEKRNNEYNYIIHPAFPIGYNECVMNYPGTISYKSKTIESIIIDFGESIKRCAFNKIVIVNHHLDLGHIKAIENAKEVLMRECEIKLLEVASSIIYSEDADKYIKVIEGIDMRNEVHADYRETSFMLYKHPELVRDCYSKLESVYMNVENFVKSGGKHWDESGINDGYIGSPSKASKNAGEKMFKDSVKNVTSLILDFIENNNIPRLSKNIENAMKHMILR
jgi:creatinine amidohydrolase